MPNSNPTTVDEISDDEYFLSHSRDNWYNSPKPLLVRVANRYWVYGDRLMRKRGDAIDSSTWTRPELAKFLNVRRARNIVPLLSLNVLKQERIPEDPHVSAKANTKLKATRTVLGSTVLEEVWTDIDCTVIPSWINPLPQQLGTQSFGTLSADQWRWLATLMLPITLIRLWGHLCLDPDNRYFAMLKNFMELVLILDLVTRRSTTSERRSTINKTIYSYLAGLRELFPQCELTTNLHMMAHLPKFLELFGPPHSWWCFPFERFNGILQRIPTNSRFGEYGLFCSSELYLK